MTKKEKTILSALGVIALLLWAVVGYDYYHYTSMVTAHDNAVAQKMEKQKEVDALTDSLYLNFTSPDLKMANVKGFVHTIEYDDDLLYVNVKKLVFDQDGMLTEMRVVYNDGGKTCKASFTRNDRGQITSVSANATYVTNYDESVRRNTKGTFKYDTEGVLVSLDVNEEDGSYGYKKSLSKFEEGKGYTASETSEYFWFGERGEKCNLRFSAFENDDMGNWTSRTAKINSKSAYMDEVETSTDTKKQGRVITYYSKKEIDFTKHLNKK